jgi:hypothetical protein
VRSSSPTPHNFFNAAKSRFATGSRRRIKELQSQALAQVARAYSGRIEGLQNAEHSFDFLHAGAELFRRRRQIGAEVPGFIDQIDQILTDHAPRRLGDGDDKLLPQPIRERGFGGTVSLEIVVAVGTAGADRSPLRISGRPLGDAHAFRMPFIGKSVVEARFGAMLGAVLNRRAFAFTPFLAVRPIAIRRRRRFGFR